MINTTEQLVELNKSNLETFVSLANIALNGYERFVQFQLEAARSVLEDSARNAKLFASIKDVQELNGLRTQLVEPSLEKAMGYSRSLYEIAAQTQAEATQVLEGRVAEYNKTVITAIDKALKSAPAGADVAAAAVKSAVTAASSAFDTFSKAAKQVTELAENGLKATAQAASKKKVA